MGEPATPSLRNVDDFLAWEERQPERYELVGGITRLMAGGSANHDLIAVNIIGTMRGLLRGTPWRAHGSNLKVRSAAGSIMYPMPSSGAGLTGAMRRSSMTRFSS